MMATCKATAKEFFFIGLGYYFSAGFFCCEKSQASSGVGPA